MQKQAGPTCVSPSQPNKHRPPSSWPSPLVTSTRSRTAYGQSSAPVAQPQHPLAGDAAAVHSTASNAADRRQLPLVPPPRACAGVGNGRRLVRFLPWRLESFPIDSGNSLVIAALVASSTKTEPIFETARITASMCAEQRHRFYWKTSVPSPVARPPRGSRRRQAPAPPPVHSIAFSAAGRGAASVANGHRPRPAHAPPRAGAGPLLALTQKPQLLQYGKGWLGPPKRRDPSTQLQALLGRIRRGGWWAAEQRRPKTA
uniref:Uncharacterized protein n=1 Tax=Oryza glumipatula TaxID=40148 RepID=A0A0E0BH03_9ORYZ